MAGHRVSVALCTFNGARYLETQLESIRRQTFQVDEIVVGDDGSADATLAILSEARRDFPQLLILPSIPRAGVTANFERTIAATAGEFVFLCDQDDVWHPDRVAASLDLFLAHPDVDLVHSDAQLINGDGQELPGSLLDRLGADLSIRSALARGDAFDTLMRRNLVTGATVALRRRLLETAMPFPGAWLHDEWLAILAADRGTSRMLDRALISYRLHGGNEVGAQRITTSVRVSRLLEDRGARNRRLLARARQLADRLPAQPHGESARAKLRHEEARSSYPRARIRRIAPLLREWRTGRYERYGRGVEDVLRDLVQPATAKSAS